MSGTGNSEPIISSSGQNDSCEGIYINTNLASPQANVVAKLKKGDILTIQAASDQGPIQALDKDGNLAGNIISKEQIKLLNCIVKGKSFVADVLEVDNGQCKIQIHLE